MTQTAHKKNFKICLVSISLAKGGAERSVAMLSQMLSSLGHQVHIVVLNNEIDFKYSGTLFNLGALKPKNDHFPARLTRFKKLRGYLTTQAFDVVIDHRPKNEYFRELFYAKYIYRNLSAIYVVHSSKKQEYFTKMVTKMAAIYNTQLATVTVSNHIEQYVAKTSGVLNCSTIHNAYNPAWKQETSLDDLPATNYILSYGRLHDGIKDFSFLIHSFNASRVWKDGVSLVIMGDGPDKKMLQDLAASMPCNNHIVFSPFTKSPLFTSCIEVFFLTFRVIVTIVKAFSIDGYVIYEDKTYHDADGNEARHEHWVKSEDGTLYDCFDDTGAIDIDISDSDETPS